MFADVEYNVESEDSAASASSAEKLAASWP
jgi:hypothetical protein